MVFTSFITLLLGTSIVYSSNIHALQHVKFDPYEKSNHLFQSGSKFSSLSESKHGNEKSLITDVVLGYLIREVTRTSNYPTAVASDIGEECRNDSQDYRTANLFLVDWANKMFESTGKVPEAIAGSGNLHAYGLFEECLSVEADSTSTAFQGQYCTVFFDTDLVSPEELEDTSDSNSSNEKTNWLGVIQALNWLYNGPSLKIPKVQDTDKYSRYLPGVDFCIPSSCSVEDFRTSVAQLVGSRTIGNRTVDGDFYYTSVVTITDEKYCYTKGKVATTSDFNGADVAVITTLGLLGFVCLLATGHELWITSTKQLIQPGSGGLLVKCLHCFSMLTNSKRLLSTKSSAVDNLCCLNGIRVMSTTWIVFFHSFMAINSPIYNKFTPVEDLLNWKLHGATNASIAVDTFLVMSGLLVTYSLLRELDRNKGRFNIGLFYLHRYLRLTPVYAVILGFIATLLAYLGSGPNWQNVRELSLTCKWNWWNNLLYVNNYVTTYPDPCMGETWYLACDMQMFLLSPLFIYPLWRWQKVGLGLAFFVILSLLGGTVAIFIVWELPAMGFFLRDNDNPHWYWDYYVQMWTRFPAYIIGILLGWTLHKTKRSTIKMTKIVVSAGWVLSSAVGLAVLFGMAPYADPSAEISDGVRVSYGVFHRFAWACCVSWMIFACINGYGGFLNGLLSWKVFIPLGRLTYVVYLIHLNYLTVYHSYLRKPYYFTHITHAEHYFGVVFMVFLMAFGICLTVEVPLLSLERLLIKPNSTGKPITVDIKHEVGSP